MALFHKKIFIIIVITFSCHIAIGFFYPITIDEMIPNSFDKINSLDTFLATTSGNTYIYFSDSVDFYHSPEDKDKRSISSLLIDRLPGWQGHVVAHKAYHVGVYRSFLEYITKQSSSFPKVVVVPINLRSFSTYWMYNPSWQFLNLRQYLEYNSWIYRIFFKPIKGFQVSEKKALPDSEYKRLTLNIRGEEYGFLRDYFGDQFRETSQANFIKKIYLYYGETIREDSIRLSELVELANLGKKIGIRVIFYITPVDFITCKQYVGEAIVNTFTQNIKKISGALRNKNVELYDFSFLLSPTHFYYGSPYPNEHLNQKGRGKLANQIAELVNK